MRWCVIHGLTRCVEGLRLLHSGLIAARCIDWPSSAPPISAINATNSEFRPPHGKIDRVLGTYEPRNLYYIHIYAHAHISIYSHTNTYLYMCMCIYIHIYFHIHTYLCICLNESLMPMLAFAAGNSVDISLTRFFFLTLYVFLCPPSFQFLSLCSPVSRQECMRWCVIHGLTRCVEGLRLLCSGLISARCIDWPASAPPISALNATNFEFRHPRGNINRVQGTYEPRNL